MKLYKPVLLVLAVAALAATVANFNAAAAEGSEEPPLEHSISFSLRILGQELLGFSFQNSRSTQTSWIKEHEEK